jgi:metal-responsive CopG/Arc/MetJ family transcriptional regulator
MKTAVSLPGELFDRAEKLARRMKKSRSRLYSDAISEYVSRHDPLEVTRALDALYSEVDSHPPPAISESARRVLVSTEW